MSTYGNWSFQDWDLQRERLNVRHSSPSTTSSPISKDADNDKTIFWNGASHTAIQSDRRVLDNRSTTSCTNFEDYRRGCSQFWVDVPHQTFTRVGKTKKRRKTFTDWSCVGSQEKRWKRPKKKKRKKRTAYLVSEWILRTTCVCYNLIDLFAILSWIRLQQKIQTRKHLERTLILYENIMVIVWQYNYCHVKFALF